MGFVRINGFPMDLAVSEGHSFPGEVTKKPVEVGADVSDHIRDLPPEITLECIVSDIVPGELVNDPQRGTLVETPNGLLEEVLPREQALAKLREIKALRRPVTVETSLGKFESMAFVSLDVPTDKDKNNALFFTAKFSKFVQVTNKRTRAKVAPKATAGTEVFVNEVVVWKHDIATGQFVGVVSKVDVHYNRPEGMTREQAAAVARQAENEGAVVVGELALGMPFFQYFEHGTKIEIIGPRRAKLVADLTVQGEQANQLPPKPFAGDNIRNLPPGVSLDRFNRQVPATFGPSQQDLAGLKSRFGRQVAPTFPGS